MPLPRPVSTRTDARGEAPEMRSWTQVYMDTVVTIQLYDRAPSTVCDDAVARAHSWFEQVERQCSRFDPLSELSLLCAKPHESVLVSPLLYRLVEFALSVAQATEGAFDPTIGRTLEDKGFNRNYVTGAQVAPRRLAAVASDWRDIHLDPKQGTITLSHQLVLDLGAVAKGLAMDLALRELAGFDGGVIDAGGDIFAFGHGPHAGKWPIGIRHPGEVDKLIDLIEVSDLAVCTSGDYERRSPNSAQGHHILDPKSGDSTSTVVSATVIAPTAIAADAISTAAFVLGPVDGLRFVRSQGADCLLVTSDLKTYETNGFAAFRP